MTLKNFTEHLKAHNSLSNESLELTTIYCRIYFSVMRFKNDYSSNQIAELRELIVAVARLEWGSATVVELCHRTISISQGERIETFNALEVINAEHER